MYLPLTLSLLMVVSDRRSDSLRSTAERGKHKPAHTSGQFNDSGPHLNGAHNTCIVGCTGPVNGPPAPTWRGRVHGGGGGGVRGYFGCKS